MSEIQEKKYVYFICRRKEIPLFSIFAKQLKERLNISSVCVVQSTRDKIRAKNLYNYAVNLLEDFNPPREETRLQENKEKIQKWESLWPDFSFFRALSSDRYFSKNKHSRAFSFAYAVHIKDNLQKVFNKYPPLVLFGEKTSLSWQIIYYFCKHHNIDYFDILRARHFNDRIYFEEDINRNWKYFNQLYKEYLINGIPLEAKSIVKEKYEAITQRHSLVPTRYGRFRARGVEGLLSRLRLSAIKRYIEIIKYDIFIDHSRNPMGTSAKEFLKKFFEIPLNKIRKLYFDFVTKGDVDLEKPFACYFLHVQPEYSIDYLGFEFQNQIELIKNIATALPVGISLYVKEHTPMIGRRSVIDYKRLQKIPNVKLISDKADSHKIISKSKLVFTVVGTVGLEAVFYGIPTIIFGKVFYSQVEGVYEVNDIRSLRPLLREVLIMPKEYSIKENSLAVLAALYSASYPIKVPFTTQLPVEKISEKENQDLIGQALAREFKRRNLV